MNSSNLVKTNHVDKDIEAIMTSDQNTFKNLEDASLKCLKVLIEEKVMNSHLWHFLDSSLDK